MEVTQSEVIALCIKCDQISKPGRKRRVSICTHFTFDIKENKMETNLYTFNDI